MDGTKLIKWTIVALVIAWVIFSVAFITNEAPGTEGEILMCIMSLGIIGGATVAVLMLRRQGRR